MSANEPEFRCIALTNKGRQCKKMASPGSSYCYLHQPVASQDDAADMEMITKDVEELADVEELTDKEKRQRLIVELDNLIARVKALEPDYVPPAFSPEKMVGLMDEGLDKISPGLRSQILRRLQGTINEDLLDAETWKGIWYMINYTLTYQGDILKRRLTGNYETDEWGLDWEFVEAIRPFLDFLYKFYWRVEVSGIENIPDYNRALLISNHSGLIPWDGAMIMTTILNEHPAQRLVRFLYRNWVPTAPFVSSFLVKMGQALDSIDNGVRLLEQDELVGAFPEGFHGPSKLFKNRYRLARFERSSYVKMALRTQAPIIPVSVVGAEETYVSIANLPSLAQLIGVPYFPITLRFPWLGLLGAIPLPTKWFIDFGEPLPTDNYAEEADQEPVLVSQLTDQVRNTIQEMVNERLACRQAIFH